MCRCGLYPIWLQHTIQTKPSRNKRPVRNANLIKWFGFVKPDAIWFVASGGLMVDHVSIETIRTSRFF
jgi:hypothetical protein